MPTALENLQTAYAGVCAKIAEVVTDPKVSYTLPNGASVDREKYYKFLLEAQERLAKIPGVAPEQSPVFTVISVAR